MKITKTLVGKRRHFEDDTRERNVYRVTLSNNGERCSFLFGDSLRNTEQGIDLDDEAVLSCCKYDYYYTKEYYPTFQDFCDSLGYDEDSGSAERVYKKCLRQAEGLHRVFTKEEIEALPD